MPYVEESELIAVLVDSVQQVGLLEQKPASRGASNRIVGDDVEAGAVEISSTDQASGTSSYQDFLAVVSSFLVFSFRSGDTGCG